MNRTLDVFLYQLIAAWGAAWSITLALFAAAHSALLLGWTVTPDKYYGLVLQNP
jgi:hypothetical protein